MSTRPSRSPSIPIPRRNIDSVVSLSLAAESSPRGIRSASTSATSSFRPTPRSFTTSSISRASPQSRTFEPRIIRADSSRSVDASCIPSSSLSVPNRRASTGTHPPPTTRPATRSPTSNPQSLPKSFPRPSYLDHSAFRNLFQTQLPSPLSSHKTSDPVTSGVISDSEDDSSVSPPPAREPMFLPSPDQALSLPTRWSEQTRQSTLNLSFDGRELSYQSTSVGSEKDAAARTVESIPPACGIYYYEVDIRSKGQKAHISVGFSTAESRTSRLPGWESNSWGYYGDDGRAFTGDHGTPFGPTFGLGDVVGCGIDFTTNKVFYTKNGTLIGQVFDNVGRDAQLYPAIGLQQSNDTVIANFGHEPFKFDIDFYAQQKKNDTWAKILSTPLNAHSFAKLFSDSSGAIPEDGTKATINTLVLSYLAHHGYTKTAEAFQNQNMPIPQPLKAGDPDVEMDDPPIPQTTPFGADIKLRTQVVNAVVTGDIDSALQQMYKHHPSVLEAEDSLILIKLRCRKFVELVLEKTRTKERHSVTLGDNYLLHEFDEDRMDVDDEDSPKTLNGFSDSGKDIADDESSPDEAILYARQTLQNDYKNDSRPEVQALLKRSFGILAYRDPLKTGSIAAEVAGQQARVALASELNQAILKSQGKPAHPSLEMLYRHTAVCIQQLGILGDGCAAFVDMPREFLDAP